MPHRHKSSPRKRPGEDDIIDLCFFDKATSVSFLAKSETAASTLWSSKAMIESVEEVCRDIAWGEKREVGRIGLVMQDHICRDLIEDIVTELRCCCIYSLPFEACKRRLLF
ncbi:unnamed protein product [Ilex paraguariensis]|uniref:Uncharacterized protein n=2 Tax=Ilex paraguariensis TaxID=185542 RepID=A0ABC8TA99_9AQUA